MMEKTENKILAAIIIVFVLALTSLAICGGLFVHDQIIFSDKPQPMKEMKK